jgi:flavin reductase (DIM6/NTAB) family NADH-FMN oxidoreductase RutF
MESRNRASLMNSLSGFKSASLIGTIGANSKTNLAIFSSVVHIGSNPALIGFINRPDSVNRHTLENILESNCFTVNHVNQDIFRKAHQTAARYPKEISEFDAAGLTTEFSECLLAPYVKESSIKYGLEFIEKHELKINGTILVIGKVVEIFIPKNSLLSNNAIDIEQAKTVAISGLDTYHSTNRIARLTYAKPDSFNKEINE